ncbi:MAG: hypothetical protein RIA72_12090 [Sphingopyxis sp.]|uniref:hypothetical protein n=1 Tax=Sphingopyxis sp. TaxID=1908224 RepID=UPI0032EE5BB0
MSNYEALAAFCSEGIDAGVELERLGDDQLRYWINFLGKITSRQQDYRSNSIYLEWNGIPIFCAGTGDILVVYAVEEETDGTMVATILLAGRKAPSNISLPAEALWTTDQMRHEVERRARIHFPG